ncbi:hypothetical protein Patl1_28604 [Pistacia atlantica]|uniref:Uncharacterized protein n=1 Tax=Pistacia atlantica TaxID=434234 RepID=A0ACC1BFF2_9ROSI|nr:hypothetical protein Patl1_28604 [Pistacia atlantica]
MARELKAVNFLLIISLLLSLGSVNIEAPSLSMLKLDGSNIRRESFFEGVSLGAIEESGPSPGQGNKFMDSRGTHGCTN